MSLTDQHSAAEPCCLRQLFTLFPYYVKIKINERWKVRHRLNHVLVIYYFVNQARFHWEAIVNVGCEVKYICLTPFFVTHFAYFKLFSDTK